MRCYRRVLEDTEEKRVSETYDMKKLFTIGAVVLLGNSAGVSQANAGENVTQAWITQNLTFIPLAFTQNMGR